MAIDRLGFYSAEEVVEFLAPGGAADLSGEYEESVAPGTTAQYWRGDKTWQTLNKAAVGLGNVDNTADASKNVLSATKLTTARNINGVAFDGTANITITAADPAYTAADVLAKLLTVDGAASGLDADLLDGQSGAFYLARANHTGTQTAATISDFSTAADARVAAAVGVTVQAHDADLATIASLTATTDNFIVSVSSAWASRTPAQVRTTLGLVIGTNVQAWDADLDAVASSGLASAWTTYAPTISAGSGTFTTVSADGRYKQVGKLVMFAIDITITTNGTAGTYIDATLPVASANVAATHRAPVQGVEHQAVGFGVAGYVLNNSSTARCRKYDATYPGADGYVISLSGIYEAA